MAALGAAELAQRVVKVWCVCSLLIVCVCSLLMVCVCSLLLPSPTLLPTHPAPRGLLTHACACACAYMCSLGDRQEGCVRRRELCKTYALQDLTRHPKSILTREGSCPRQL